MANEIHIDYGSGDTLYAVIRNKAGQVWEPSGQVFEAWGASGHDADDYDISLTDKSGCHGRRCYCRGSLRVGCSCSNTDKRKKE